MNLASISVIWVGLASLLVGQDLSVQAQQVEERGDAAATRQLLQRAARNAPDDSSVLLRYAEFLDRYNDPETRANYEKALALLTGPADAAKRAAVARRLVLLDLIEGERDAAAKHLDVYHAAGGKDFAAKIPPTRPERQDEMGTIDIPGPLPLIFPHGRGLGGCERHGPPTCPGPERHHQRIPGVIQRRGARAYRVHEADRPVSVAGPGVGKAGRRAEDDPD